MLQVQAIELTRLYPWEGNPRLNDHAVAAVAESIKSFGFNVPILCDQNLTIVAGHTRWKAAQNLGMATVPVIVVEMTDARDAGEEVYERLRHIADEHTTELVICACKKTRTLLTAYAIPAGPDPSGLGRASSGVCFMKPAEPLQPGQMLLQNIPLKLLVPHPENSNFMEAECEHTQ